MSFWKPLAWLAAGGVGGAVGAYWLLDEQANSGSESGVESLIASVADITLGRDEARSAAAIAVADHLDAYREAQAQNDPAALTEALERAAARRWTPERDLEIDALIGRLAELDPEYAAAVAVALGLDDVATAEAFLAWATADPEAAVAGLSTIAHPAVRHQVALALTDVFGNDARGIARIGAALSQSERDALMLDRIALRAASDPFGAFREVQALGRPELMRSAVDTLAPIWAAQDPQGALVQAGLLPTQLATIFQGLVFAEWARLDTEGFAAYLESGEGLPPAATSGLDYLLAVDPARVELVAANFPGSEAQFVRNRALAASALQDPAAAMARIGSLPPGEERDSFVQAVATALVSQDPAAALDWVRSLAPVSTNASRAFAMALASEDIAYAYRMIDDPAAFGLESTLAYTIVSTLAVNDLGSAPDLAGRLLERSDAESRAALRNLVVNWMDRDPQKALEWMLGSGAEVDGSVLGGAAQTLAARDPAAAASYVGRIPEQFRGVWVTAVAKEYGRNDISGALNWVSNYQGQAVYEVAMREIISSAAQANPQAAAQALLQASPDAQLGAARTVGTAFARQDPQAAARWATSLSDQGARAVAVGGVATAWYDLDRAAARRWLLSQPAAPERDELVMSLVMQSMLGNSFDEEMLDAISSAETREGIATMAVGTMADDDPVRARALLEREVRNPEQRARLEGLIEQNTRR